MNRAKTIEEIKEQSVAIGFPVAFHCEAEGQVCDRYYAHDMSTLITRARRALKAAKKNGADGVLVLPYPNTRRTLPDRSHE